MNLYTLFHQAVLISLKILLWKYALRNKNCVYCQINNWCGNFFRCYTTTFMAKANTSRVTFLLGMCTPKWCKHIGEDTGVWKVNQYPISNQTPLSLLPQGWVAEVCDQSMHHSTSENSRGAGQMDSKLGDERLKARPRATASMRGGLCFPPLENQWAKWGGGMEEILLRHYKDWDEGMFTHFSAPFQFQFTSGNLTLETELR